MDLTQTQIYIRDSKKNIDNYMSKNDYKSAFFLLICSLERLDSNERTEVIEYYGAMFDNIIKDIGVTSLNPCYANRR